MSDQPDWTAERQLRGTLIAGRYRVEEAIGRGPLGTVYRATDVALGRDVAIKILHQSLCDDAEFVQRFRREAHSAAKLQHPNIVQVYDTGVDAGRCYVVMEYLGEPDLKSIITDYAPLPIDKVVQVGIEICEALEYAHNNDIVHRNLKPQNVLFTNEGRAKVSDAGVACAADATNMTQRRTILGSVHYTSPEQAAGSPAGPQSDIYALGVILYEAATGRLPFAGDSPKRIIESHLHDRPRSPRSLNPTVSPSLEYVITKALTKDISRRYRSAAELLHDLRKLQSGHDLERTGVLPMPNAVRRVVRPVEAARPYQAVPTPAEPGSGGELAASRRRATVEETGVPLRGIAVAVAVAIVLVAAIAYALYHVAYSGKADRRVQVPSVVGMTEADAREALKAAGLRIGRKPEQEDDMRPAGTIISQSPTFGEFVEENQPVDVVIAVRTKPAVVIVPILTGKTRDEARRALEADGLVLGATSPGYSDTVAAGCVISQSIKGREHAEKGTPVDVVISQGPRPDEVIPPDVPPPAANGPAPVIEQPAAPAGAVVQIRRDEEWRSAPGQCRVEVAVSIEGAADRTHRVSIESIDQDGAEPVHQWDGLMSEGAAEKTIPVFVRTGAIVRVRVDGELVKEWRAPNT